MANSMFRSFGVDGGGPLPHYFECVSECGNSFFVSLIVYIIVIASEELSGKEPGYHQLAIENFTYMEVTLRARILFESMINAISPKEVKKPKIQHGGPAQTLCFSDNATVAE